MTISDRAGAPIFGSPAKRVRYIVEGSGGDVADLMAAVHGAPPGLAISAYVEIVSQARARRQLAELTPKREPITEWRPAHELEDSAPPPWVAAGVTRDEWAAGGAVPCETTSGGGA